ncbi:peptidylprolyl isomerase [Aquisphaera insulae]|uniref:peptidylprolyl isomerase n=1 Tax=Aquisphaera insulae TaxID=2712864 RepID=UPI0013EDAA03|nr:peptidylprolyl isomerase [Aquisphaera insulae]
MKQRIALGLLSLLAAGCAQPRPTLPQPPGAARPVGLEPVPVLSDTINRGTGDRAVQRTALGDPRNRKWSGNFIPQESPAPMEASVAPDRTQSVRPSPSSPHMGTPPAEPAPAHQPPAASTSAARNADASTAAAAPAELPPIDETASGVEAGPGDRKDGPVAAATADPLLGPDPNVAPPVEPPPAAGPNPNSAPTAPPTGGEPPLEMAPEPSATPQPQASTTSPAAPAQPGAGVVKASYNPDTLKESDINRDWKQAGGSAARVGNEVITYHDLVVAVQERIGKIAPGQRPTPAELTMVAKVVLTGLIERTLITQEAKRILKNPKQLDRLYAAADQYFREQELPIMMHRYLVETETQLRDKMAESGKSLDALRQSFRQEFLAQAFLEQKLIDCRKVELPEMLKYYSEHMHDREFDRPAQVTWRELIVETGGHPDPADARRKAESLLARLRKGEDFAALAKAESEGPSAIKAQGGLMQTSPGSYAVESVNQALSTLPLNQISPILEGPSSLHIVKVESRRDAGPASFEEIQEQLRRTIMMNKIRKGREELIAKLKRNTPISSKVVDTGSDPSASASE